MEIKNYLGLIKEKDLTEAQSGKLLKLLMEDKTTSGEIGEILKALADKGETVDEIAGFAKGMRALMVEVNNAVGAVDIVGTGGDGSNSFNISTTSAIVIAACGVPVAKHGNRAASSKCGSADVLEALGVNINLTPEKAKEVLEKTGMVFLFAPMFHPAMKKVGPVRKELKIRTIFNYLGPFLNPGKVKRMLLGVANHELALKFLDIAKKLDFKHLLIVSSNDGSDEISIADKTTALQLKNGKVEKFIIDPQKLGFKKYSKNDLVGGDAEVNARILKYILSGKEIGAKKDAIILNSAYGLLVAGKVTSADAGIALASDAIDSGKALKVLENLIEQSSRFENVKETN